MTGPLEMSAPCPCGTEALWIGTQPAAGTPESGTSWDILCPRCEGWTVAAQLARWRVMAEQDAAPVPLPVVSPFGGNPLWRMFRAATDRIGRTA